MPSLAKVLLSLIICGIILSNSIELNAQIWGTPVFLETLAGTGGQTGQYTSLQVVNGNPAIVYLDGSHNNLMFLRANDASGSTWGTPIVIDTNGGAFTSLQNC